MRDLTSPLDGFRSPFGAVRGSVFSPSSLFGASEAGAFYDPSDLTSIYQETDGGDTGAVGQTVGIMLDKRLMGASTAAAFIAAQSDILTTSASVPGGWTYDSGTATVTASGTAGLDNITITLDTTVSAGSYCEITIPNTMPSSAFYVDYGGGKGGQVGALSSATNTVVIDPTADSTTIRIGRWSGSPTGTIGPITVKEIPGNHAVAPSDAARPILRATALDTAATTGSELVTNGTFAADVTGWSNQSGGAISWQSGVMRVTPALADSQGFGEQSIATVSGKVYKVMVDVTASTATSNGRIYVGTAASLTNLADTGPGQGVGTYTIIFTASSSTSYLGMGAVANLDGAQYVEFDNVTVLEVAAADYLYYLEPDGVDDWMPSSPLADLGETWSHVGGWQSETNNKWPFTTTGDVSGFSGPADQSNIWTWANTTPASAPISTSDPATAANVLTIEQANTTSLVARVDGTEERSAITPYDDSAETQGLALFTFANDRSAGGWDGKFFGGTWIARALTADERLNTETYTATKTGVTL